MRLLGVRTNLRGECLAVKTIRVYNMLPAQLRGLQIGQFKKEIKKWVKPEIPIKPP